MTGNWKPIEFAAIAEASPINLRSLLAEWLPNGRLMGREWVALNPTRADLSPGSFRINLDSGLWADFATGDKGGDAISLFAYLNGLQQGQAARALAQRLGVTAWAPCETCATQKQALPILSTCIAIKRVRPC
ncbi:hypothetical protein [Parasedimentitalea denitrificans]|uniref:hypothetical protein n=1 Tax=Parasedimentitalea denitrificans TaxID=2211118 RepID=UPI00197DD908|nr:hypothetical protein [Sedimentitalea sp. CY04]